MQLETIHFQYFAVGSHQFYPSPVGKISEVASGLNGLGHGRLADIHLTAGLFHLSTNVVNTLV